LPRRPDPSLLSEAIPLFYIFRNGDGFWVARDCDERVGGIFLRKRSALQFANRSAQPTGCATILLSDRFELGIENSGNPFIAHFAAAKRAVTCLAQGLVALIGNAAAMGQVLFARFLRARAEERLHRTAIERELLHNRFKISSKNDDDLPVVS
jgi:hypothetical protein